MARCTVASVANEGRSRRPVRTPLHHSHTPPGVQCKGAHGGRARAQHYCSYGRHPQGALLSRRVALRGTGMRGSVSAVLARGVVELEVCGACSAEGAAGRVPARVHQGSASRRLPLCPLRCARACVRWARGWMGGWRVGGWACACGGGGVRVGVCVCGWGYPPVHFGCGRSCACACVGVGGRVEGMLPSRGDARSSLAAPAGDTPPGPQQ